MYLENKNNIIYLLYELNVLICKTLKKQKIGRKQKCLEIYKNMENKNHSKLLFTALKFENSGLLFQNKSLASFQLVLLLNCKSLMCICLI